MRTSMVLVFGLLLFTVQSNSQFNRQWWAEYVTSGSPGDIIADLSLNCYVTGSGSDGFVTLKYNSGGVLQWTHISGGGLGDALLLDANQNIVCGGRQANGGNLRYFVQKISPAGTVIWSSPLIGNSQVNSPLRMVMDANGDIIMTGTDPASGVGRQTVTAKINGVTGAVDWSRNWNYPLIAGHDYGRDVVVNPAGDIYVCGSGQREAFFSDLVILKYSAAGTLLWEAKHSGGGTKTLEAKSVTLDASGNIIAAGYKAASTTTATRDFFTVKYDPAGNLLWEHEYDEQGRQDEAVKVLTDPAQNVYVTGVVKRDVTGDDILTIKYNSAGSVLWQHRYHSVSNAGDYPTEMSIGKRGYLHVFGFGGSRMSVLSYDPGGTLLAAHRDTTMDDAHHLAACFDHLGGTYMTTRAPTNIPRYHTIKLTSNLTNIEPGDVAVPARFELHQNYPNPFNPITTIDFSILMEGHVSLKVYDMLGREVTSLVDGDLPAGNHKRQFDATSMASGVYLYRLTIGEFVQTRKLVLMR